MHKKIICSMLLAGCASGPAWSQSAFDGFRFGVEAAHSWSTVRVDAGRPVAAGVARARDGIAQAEAGRAQAESGRAQAIAGRSQAEALAREASSSESQARAALNAASLMGDAAGIARAQAAIDAASAALAQANGFIAQAETAIATADLGITRADAGLSTAQSSLSILNSFSPTQNLSSDTSAVRVSAGYGRTAGWIHPALSNLYLGIEGDYTTGGGAVSVQVPLRSSVRIQMGQSYGVYGRVGYVVHPRVMLYGTAGWEGVEWTYSRGSGQGSSLHEGARMGLGAEYSIGGGWLLKAGYNHWVGGGARVSGADISASRNTVHVGVVRTF